MKGMLAPTNTKLWSEINYLSFHTGTGTSHKVVTVLVIMEGCTSTPIPTISYHLVQYDSTKLLVGFDTLVPVLG